MINSQDITLMSTATTATATDNNDTTMMTLRVKASTFKDSEISLARTASIKMAKQAILETLGENAQGRYLRLICKGRMLAPDTATLEGFSLASGDVLHAVLAAQGVRGGQQAALARGTTQRFRGTGVNAQGRIERPSGNEDAEEETDEEEGRERIGFDRLRSSGLSRHEITAIRTYFSRQVDRYLLTNPNIHSEEPDLVRRRLLQEDAWMQTQGPSSEFRLNLNQNNLQWPDPAMFRSAVGTDRDFLWGFLLGFFVGFLMLVWVWMPTVPHKQKLGILTGISLQLAMSLLRKTDEEQILEDAV